MKSSWVKWIASIVFPVASMALLLVLGFTVEDVHLAWNALLGVRKGYIAAVVVCWCAYVGFRALALVVFCRLQGCGQGVMTAGDSDNLVEMDEVSCDKSVDDAKETQPPSDVKLANARLTYFAALRITLVGFFYSGITPAATGGQPMQIYELRKRGVPASAGTSAVAVETAGFQFLLVIFTLGFYLAYRQGVSSALSVAKWVLITGFMMNLVWTSFLALVLIKGAWVAKPIVLLLRLLGKARLLRNPEKRIASLNNYVAEYELIASRMFTRPVLMLSSAVFSGLQVISYMSIVYFIYRGFGWNATPFGVAVTIQMLMYLCASMVPTPGATGAQEGAFYVFLGGIFPESSVFPALLVWRFFTYYLMLIAGALMLLVGMVRDRLVQPRVKPSRA